MYGNRANFYGGGVYLLAGDGSMISGSVYGNNASYGGEIYIQDLSGVSILNSYTTNNWTSYLNSVIHLYNNGALTNLVISNC